MTVVFLAWVLAAGPTLEPAFSSTEAANPPIDLVWLVGSSLPDPLPPKPAVTKRLLARGRAIYGSACSGCHGVEGRGDGRLAPRLKVPPTNFAAAVFKVRSTPSGALPGAGDPFRPVPRGPNGTAMFPATALSAGDRWALVFHIESLSPRFRAEQRAPGIRVPP